jgi:ATP sulfurylase
MVKPITTKRELARFEKYLKTVRNGCKTLYNVYSRYSDRKESIWNGIIREKSSNMGCYLTVLGHNSYSFTTGYMICASDTEWYFVTHSPNGRVELKLTAEQIEEAREVINGRN